MRIGTSAALAAFVFSLVASAVAQSPIHKKVYGYQDESGNFHQLPRAVPSPEVAATFTGTIEVTFDITIKSHFASGTKVYCGADFITESTNETNPTSGGITYEEEGIGVAPASSGTTTCTVTIPYSWVLNGPGTGVINGFSGSYSVVAVNASLPTVLDVTTGVRAVEGAIASATPIPTNGTTKSFTVHATL
jgi:hypothetical protein